MRRPTLLLLFLCASCLAGALRAGEQDLMPMRESGDDNGIRRVNIFRSGSLFPVPESAPLRKSSFSSALLQDADISGPSPAEQRYLGWKNHCAPSPTSPEVQPENRASFTEVLPYERKFTPGSGGLLGFLAPP